MCILLVMMHTACCCHYDLSRVCFPPGISSLCQGRSSRWFPHTVRQIGGCYILPLPTPLFLSLRPSLSCSGTHSHSMTYAFSALALPLVLLLLLELLLPVLCYRLTPGLKRLSVPLFWTTSSAFSTGEE